jgi:hypothetical protein
VNEVGWLRETESIECEVLPILLRGKPDGLDTGALSCDDI